MSHSLSAIVLLAAGAAAMPAFGAELAHPGTLRATFIATNPVQAKADPKTGEVTGPAAEDALSVDFEQYH